MNTNALQADNISPTAPFSSSTPRSSCSSADTFVERVSETIDRLLQTPSPSIGGPPFQPKHEHAITFDLNRESQVQKIIVYVVDDETVIASTLAVILQQSGFEAFPFTSPLEALKQARTDFPDLLVTDVMMPQLSGIDLALQIQEICPKCRILLFSGQAATADLLKEAREKGHDFSLVSKPIHPKDLLRSIRNLADSSLLEIATTHAQI